MYPTHDRILKYFAYAHLPEHLQSVSFDFYQLANNLANKPNTDFEETAVALRKLLEAKDAAVRAAI